MSFNLNDINILAFGEILWDVFPDERKIGGAPFNFAAHCSKLGASADLVTAVGDDENGREASEYIKKYGVGDRYVYHSTLETGHCDVTLTCGQPEYRLVSPVAYDDIRLSVEQISGIKKYDVLYCGTLALRNSVSAATLSDLIRRLGAKLLVDVNIRQSFYSFYILEKLFSEAAFIKISRDELHAVCETLSLPEEYDLFAGKVFEKYKNTELIALTLDKEGAVIYERNGNVFHSSVPEGNPVSAVGAGDSFTAAFIVNFLQGHSVPECLEKAVKLSSLVVGYTGAVPDYDPEQFI